MIDIALLRYKTDEMAGPRGRGLGEPVEGAGFYEVKYHDPDGVVFDLTENGWAGTFPAPDPKKNRR